MGTPANVPVSQNTDIYIQTDFLTVSYKDLLCDDTIQRGLQHILRVSNMQRQVHPLSSS